MRAVEACGDRLGRWLFPPSNAGHDGFQTQWAMSSGALNRRLQRHLQQIGRWQGESLHGIRQGSTQHAYAEGEQDIGKLARKRLWAQTESLEAYLHETRHRQRLMPGTARESGPTEGPASALGRLLYARRGALCGCWGSLWNRVRTLGSGCLLSCSF